MAITVVDKRDRDIYIGTAAELGALAGEDVALGSLFLVSDGSALHIFVGDSTWADITTLASAGALAITT